MGWGHGGYPHAPGSNTAYKQSLDRVFRRAARARRSNTPAVAIILVSNHKFSMSINEQSLGRSPPKMRATERGVKQATCVSIYDTRCIHSTPPRSLRTDVIFPHALPLAFALGRWEVLQPKVPPSFRRNRDWWAARGGGHRSVVVLHAWLAGLLAGWMFVFGWWSCLALGPWRWLRGRRRWHACSRAGTAIRALRWRSGFLGVVKRLGPTVVGKIGRASCRERV